MRALVAIDHLGERKVTTTDPDRAWATWIHVEEARRLTLTMNRWLLLQPRQLQEGMHDACKVILTEVKPDA
jgi:hypothetical protein